MSELSKINIDGTVYDVKDAVARKKLISVTGATVGQTIRISEVDENGAPTKWEAANVSGGGCEVAVDGKALVISNDGDGALELVNTTEIKEDGISRVFFDADSNNNSLDLKTVFVRVSSPAGTTSMPGYVHCYNSTSSGLAIAGAIASDMTNTAIRTTTYIAYPLFGYWQSIMYGSGANEGNKSTMSCYPWLQYRYSVEQYPTIKRVRISQKESFLIGTTIEIWGVRA